MNAVEKAKKVNFLLILSPERVLGAFFSKKYEFFLCF